MWSVTNHVCKPVSNASSVYSWLWRRCTGSFILEADLRVRLWHVELSASMSKSSRRKMFSAKGHANTEHRVTRSCLGVKSPHLIHAFQNDIRSIPIVPSFPLSSQTKFPYQETISSAEFQRLKYFRSVALAIFHNEALHRLGRSSPSCP